MKAIYMNFILLGISAGIDAKIRPLSSCSGSSMDIKVKKDGLADMKLEKWNVIPGCQKRADQDHFYLSLSLNDNLPCGTTRIRNRETGKIVYYHRLVISEKNGKEHLFKITCVVTSDDTRSNIVKRNVLPPEFEEPDFIEITSEITGMAPIPELNVNVRQGGSLIGDSVTVAPGAPLTMEVFLDTLSSSTYGILVSYMLVTDTSDKNETIIYNGCTQDQYVFENFQTTNGDFLTAKFRAFKFPGSTYLLFKGNVDVCLDKCQGITCSNGEIGYGKRRRRSLADDTNKIYEMTMMTFVKFEDSPTGSTDYLFGAKKETPSTVYVEEDIRMNSSPSFYSFFGLNSGPTTISNFILLIVTVVGLNIA